MPLTDTLFPSPFRLRSRLHPLRTRRLLLGLTALCAGLIFCGQEARSQVTLQIVNNFDTSVANAADYFGNHYTDSNVWLYFMNTGGVVSYTDSVSGTTQTVTDATAFKFSDVKDGIFSLGVGSVSTKVFAALGPTNPFSGTNGPQLFDKNVPYALAEWTINGNEYDNVDVSYEDSVAFPTRLTVKDAGGTQTGVAGFKAGTQARDIINRFKQVMPSTPTGPNNTNYPSQGSIGYGPLVETAGDGSEARRWIGSSKYWISAPAAESGTLRSTYIYAPSFDNYLGYLKEHTPTTQTAAGAKTGWYIDYSGDGGYSAFVEVTGDAENGYGLQIHSVRVNTHGSAADNWKADPNAGEGTTGTITIIANGQTVAFGDGTNVTGQWTDATIYSGASMIDGDFASGPVVIATGDFAADGAYHALVPTLLASISASMATGLLGSDLYNTAYNTGDPNAADRKATMYWFNTMSAEDALQQLFAKAWDENSEFYDPFWAVLAELTEMQGYLSPFNDRWANFNSDFSLVPEGSITWELGLQQAIPEPATYMLIISGFALGASLWLRRRGKRLAV